MRTALRFGLLKHTVLPRLACQRLTWLVFFVYAVTAAAAHLSITEPDIDEGVFEGSATMVTFAVIF